MSTAYQDLAEKIFKLEQRIARLEAERKVMDSTDETDKSEEEAVNSER